MTKLLKHVLAKSVGKPLDACVFSDLSFGALAQALSINFMALALELSLTHRFNLLIKGKQL